MSDIRCPHCRGAKKVPKLGGIIGDCNRCTGTGFVSSASTVDAIEVIHSPSIKDIVKQVANVRQTPIDPGLAPKVDDSPAIHTPGNKKAVYKRKTSK